MELYDYIKENTNFDFYGELNKVTDDDVRRVLNKRKLTPEDFLVLISDKAGEHLEELAQKSHALTTQYFGNTVSLYTPLYIANYCVNKCAYCGYNYDNKIHRKKLTIDEIENEAKAISDRGFKHILYLTGESPMDTPTDYVVNAAKILTKYFSSVAIEVYPMTEEDYKRVVDAGVDSLTVYQEVYDEKIYDKVHIAGPKKNYRFRLDAIERGCKAGMRSVNLAPLLGLNEWKIEVYKMMLHGTYLRKNILKLKWDFLSQGLDPVLEVIMIYKR